MQKELIEGARTIPASQGQVTDEICRRATQILAEPVSRWLNGAEPTGARLEEVLFELLRDSYQYDGYELAKSLEGDHHWDGVDGELVEILNGAYSAISSALDRAQAK